MKKLTMIKMQGCPYCANAFRAIDELKQEHPEYAGIDVEVIDENEQPELAAPYGKDYYYVPSIFVAGKKCYEAKPGQMYEEIKKNVAQAFTEAVEP